jgi:SAM-dependent methyltransferase
MSSSQTDIERIDALWGNPEAWVADGLQWTHLETIQEMINRQVTGDADTGPLDWFFTRMGQKRRVPVDRALVLACGVSSGIERTLITEGWVREVVAVDISPGALAHAEEITKSLGIDGIRYQIDDMNDLAVEGPFDAVIGISAIHHCMDLENLYQSIDRILTPDGAIFINDFIGPSRFQWSDAQVLQVNRLLQILPDRFVLTKTGLTRRFYDRVSPETIAAFDPSEAVRSAEILPLLAERFHIEERRSYGGDVLHLVLGAIAQNFDPDLSGDPTGPAYLELLIEASDHLRASGRSVDDFAVVIGRRASN